MRTRAARAEGAGSRRPQVGEEGGSHPPGGAFFCFKAASAVAPPLGLFQIAARGRCRCASASGCASGAVRGEPRAEGPVRGRDASGLLGVGGAETSSDRDLPRTRAFTFANRESHEGAQG